MRQILLVTLPFACMLTCYVNRAYQAYRVERRRAMQRLYTDLKLRHGYR